jgi:RNA polymerase sigma factor (sigma-70 family)
MSVQFAVNALPVSSKDPPPARRELVSLPELIAAAAAGEQRGWLGLIDRYGPLVWQVARRYRLSDYESQDVSQTVWLRLLEQVGRIREPLALPGWLVTTTRNEALRVLKANQRTRPVLAIDNPTFERERQETTAEEGLLRDERHQAVRDGLAELKPEHRALLLLLHAEPAVSYAEISRRLGMPVGSIGPTRARYLKKLQQTTAIRQLDAS